jgi:hypothetical protein
MNTEFRGQRRQGRRPVPGGVGLTLLLLVLGVSAAPAQPNYSLDWFSVDGGGGTSTGGVYAVSGTIGQPDAGPTLKGGNYALDGGFWGILAAIQAPGAPWLTVTRTATNSVIISWPSPSTGWTLWDNTNLNTTNWSEVLMSPNDDGTTKSVTVAPPLGNRFYRLKKP